MMTRNNHQFDLTLSKMVFGFGIKGLNKIRYTCPRIFLTQETGMTKEKIIKNTKRIKIISSI